MGSENDSQQVTTTNLLFAYDRVGRNFSESNPICNIAK